MTLLLIGINIKVSSSFAATVVVCQAFANDDNCHDIAHSTTTTSTDNTTTATTNSTIMTMTATTTITTTTTTTTTTKR